MVLHTPFTIFKAPDVGAVTHAKFFPHNANSLDELNKHESSLQDWKSISLPDDWSEHQLNNEQIWYRADVILGEYSEQVWAIYLPSVTHNAAVYINGIWVGQGGKFTDPVSRHHNEPLLFNFSSKLLLQGKNQIDIRVKAAYFKQGLLDQFYIAPESQLHDAYVWKKVIRVDLIKWITMVMYVISAVVLVFWLARPQDKIYAFLQEEVDVIVATVAFGMGQER